MRATVHLVDTATASISGPIHRRATRDAFAGQELVADAVVKKLEPRLLDAGQRAARAAG